jgi:hypothetical protein
VKKKSSRGYYSQYDVNLSFEVGGTERHHVDFHWDAKWATATARVDGEVVLHERHPFGIRKIRRYQVSVGASEPHSVVFEKRKPLAALGGAWRRQSFTVLVDGTVLEDSGEANPMARPKGS